MRHTRRIIKRAKDRRAALARERNLIKYRRERRRRRKGRSETPRVSRSSILQKPITKVVAPALFSILDNYDQCMPFFNRIFSHVKNSDRVFLDMSGITRITTDAIIYLLTQMHSYKARFAYIHLEGNMPTDSQSRDILQASGFTNHVHTKVYPVRTIRAK